MSERDYIPTVLDAEIATKLFGLAVTWQHVVWNPYPDYFDSADPLWVTQYDPGVLLPCEGWHEGQEYGNAVRDYHADIALAWTVVEAMVKRGYQLSLQYSSAGSYVCFYTDTASGIAIVDAGNVPDAICRAALDALKEEESREHTPPL